MGDINNSRVRLLRLVAIVVAVCLLDALVASLVQRPLPWAATTPGLIPLLIIGWIVVPMQQARKR